MQENSKYLDHKIGVHYHYVENSNGQIFEIPCPLKGLFCKYGRATPKELGEWIEESTASFWSFVEFMTWLKKRRRKTKR